MATKAMKQAAMKAMKKEQAKQAMKKKQATQMKAMKAAQAMKAMKKATPMKAMKATPMKAMKKKIGWVRYEVPTAGAPKIMIDAPQASPTKQTTYLKRNVHRNEKNCCSRHY